MSSLTKRQAENVKGGAVFSATEELSWNVREWFSTLRDL
jgi:hypothetical protein